MEKILLGHGSGGKLSHNLVSDIFLPFFKNSYLERMDDAAVCSIKGSEVVFSTDSFVVDPIFFPGGDIGKLAVCGTVNDLVMMGANPKYLSAAFILEEGLRIGDLKKILLSMQEAAAEAGVWIVTGDTKVVPKGAADKIFINTTGVGEKQSGIDPRGDRARPGDVVIINGAIAEHGVAVMAKREGLALDVDIKTDCAPLNDLVGKVLEKVPDIHVMRDPTRGGVATTLNEIARQSDIGIKLYENRLPVPQPVQSVCEILGLDPLYIANEGKCLILCAAKDTKQVLAAMKSHKHGREACIIGEITDSPRGKVYMETLIGGQRIIDMLAGEQLPRIC